MRLDEAEMKAYARSVGHWDKLPDVGTRVRRKDGPRDETGVVIGNGGFEIYGEIGVQMDHGYGKCYGEARHWELDPNANPNANPKGTSK